jgi:hypothetical protein
MSSVWPPADFEHWPDTRIAALSYCGIVLLVVAVPPSRRLICYSPWDACGQSCGVVVRAVVLGFVWSVFAHFIPCIWWTCDWGAHDGQAVRGAIWFVLWAVLICYLLYTGRKRHGCCGRGGDSFAPSNIP